MAQDLLFQDSYPSSIDIFFRPFSPLDSFEADILSSEEGLHFDEGNETQHDSSHEKGEKPSAFTTLEDSKEQRTKSHVSDTYEISNFENESCKLADSSPHPHQLRKYGNRNINQPIHLYVKELMAQAFKTGKFTTRLVGKMALRDIVHARIHPLTSKLQKVPIGRRTVEGEKQIAAEFWSESQEIEVDEIKAMIESSKDFFIDNCHTKKISNILSQRDSSKSKKLEPGTKKYMKKALSSELARLLIYDEFIEIWKEVIEQSYSERKKCINYLDFIMS